MLKKNLETHIRQIQENGDLSLSAMSRRTGIAKTTLLAILQGRGNLRLSTVEKMAKSLEVNPVRLISDQDCEDALQTYIGLVRRLHTAGRLSEKQEFAVAGLLEHMVKILDSVQHGTGV